MILPSPKFVSSWVFFIWFFSMMLVHAFETVILETCDDGETQIIEGDLKLAERLVTPASTFKIVIAWAALEVGLVTPETKHLCSDSHIDGTPKKLSLQEAMYFSSNDYFVWLIEMLGKKQLQEAVEQSHFFDKPLPPTWSSLSIKEMVHAGNLCVNAVQQHQFIQNVMNGKLASSTQIQENLLKAMSWPSKDSKTQLYGKTGSLKGVYWFNGFGQSSSQQKAVTVLLIGEGASRSFAIEQFYKRWEKKAKENHS